MNLYQIFEQNVNANPTKVACILPHEQVTYQQLHQQVESFAHFLHHQIGVCQGDVIALFSGNNKEFAISLLAAAKLGAAVAPLPLSLKGANLESSLAHLSCKASIAWFTVANALIEKSLMQRDKVIAFGGAANAVFSFEEACATKERLTLPPAPVTSDYILTLTSGSTGNPKPIVFTQETKLNRAFTATRDIYGLSESDVTLVSTPLYHSLAQRSLLLPLLLGGTAVILPKFTIQGWLNAVTAHKVTFLFAVSSQLESLLKEIAPEGNCELAHGYDFSSLRCIVSSSAVLDAETKAKLVGVFPCTLHECYGASEMGVITDFNFNEYPQHIGSVGKALPFLNVKITDENRQSVAAGTIGEIACRSKTKFKEYMGLPEVTANAYDELGFFYTGDLGYVDEDGFLYYTGRSKDVIISGGINIYPQDIEKAVLSLTEIDDCMAMSVCDEQFGEVIKVLYTTSDDSKDFTLAIRKACLTQLTDYQQPRYIERIDAFPKSSLGKILRQQVKQTYGQ